MAKSMMPFVFTLFLFHRSLAGFLVEPAQPLKPGDYSTPNTVPAFPVQTLTPTCRLDLSAELFGGVKDACSRNLDRSRCCPVLAAWLFAAHARSALQVSAAVPPASSDLPMMPDDSQKCVNSLQSSLQSRNINIPQPNASCDAVLCFCGIRLHQITSLSCPAAFNVTANRNATPTAAVRNLERNCRNSSYAGCTKCLGALQRLKGEGKNGSEEVGGSDRASKMFSRDCQLMGLTWLLARNKTAYIPTVSAVLRAVMYSAHPPHETKCSPDQENMPLAVDSLQFEKADSSSSSSPCPAFIEALLAALRVCKSLCLLRHVPLAVAELLLLELLTAALLLGLSSGVCRTVSSGAPSQTVPSGEAQQSYPPGIQSQSTTPVQTAPANIYGNSVAVVPPTVQPVYPTSFGYPSYYGVTPQQPPPPPVSQPVVDHSQNIGNVPWATNPPMPPPVSSDEKATYGTDAEYEKFMAEMK